MSERRKQVLRFRTMLRRCAALEPEARAKWIEDHSSPAFEGSGELADAVPRLLRELPARDRCRRLLGVLYADPIRALDCYVAVVATFGGTNFPWTRALIERHPELLGTRRRAPRPAETHALLRTLGAAAFYRSCEAEVEGGWPVAALRPEQLFGHVFTPQETIAFLEGLTDDQATRLTYDRPALLLFFRCAFRRW